MEQKTIKAILFDAEKATITTIELDAANVLDSFYKHIGCELVTVVSHLHWGPVANSLLVDDEGLLKDHETIKGGFYYHDGTAIWQCVGNGIISGCNAEGETVDTNLTPDFFTKRVKFFGPNEARAYMREVLGSEPQIINFD